MKVKREVLIMNIGKQGREYKSNTNVIALPYNTPRSLNPGFIMKFYFAMNPVTSPVRARERGGKVIIFISCTNYLD